ncbi:MAG: ABC transporter substrate-binding protein [Gammaproteobacteria bacterium]|jgi:dipeptide transport system substrate-binding protein|nr:ABC transporter substrate-binding protein [Gammaproteobacteria bacterium]
MRKTLALFALLSLAQTPLLASAGSTLVYCSEGSPEAFNPQLATSGTTFDASSRQIYNRLVEFEIGTTNIGPGLAERWSVSEDGKIYTFHLRKGVKFHTTKYFTPTRDFNADDVIFSFDRQRKKDHPYHSVGGAIYKYFDDMDMVNLITDLKKLDDYTVEFHLARPESPFIANMAMDFASILSAEYGDQLMKAGNPERIDLDPVGTGPFFFRRYEKDAFIRYRAHPQYWRGREKLENLVFAITVDPSVRYARLRTGECHVMAYPLPADIPAMKKDPALVVTSQPGLNVGYWALNVTKKPFDDVRVRRAMAHAINKAAIIEAVFLGTGQAAKNPIPPTIWSYNDAIQDYDYNPERARALLKEAGLDGGFQTDIWAMPVQRPYNPNARKMAEMIQADLKKVGIEAKVVSYEWGTYLQKSREGEHQTILLGWTGDNGDPDNFFGPLMSCAAAKTGNNRARWCDPEFDKLITEARMLSDKAARTRLYEKAQEVVHRELPWISVAHSIRYQPSRSSVKGLKIDPFGGIYFSGVTVE